MDFSISWDINEYRTRYESVEHWELKEEFMIKYKDRFPEERLACLSQIYVNIELMRCRYPMAVMKQMAELSKDLSNKYRASRKNFLHRTFVKATDAANDRVRAKLDRPKGKKLNNETDGEKNGVHIKFVKCSTDHSGKSNNDDPLSDTMGESMKHPAISNDNMAERSDVYPLSDMVIVITVYVQPNYMKVWKILSDTFRESERDVELDRQQLGPELVKCSLYVSGILIGQSEGEIYDDVKDIAGEEALRFLGKHCYILKVLECEISDADTIELADIDSTGGGAMSDALGEQMETSYETQVKDIRDDNGTRKYGKSDTLIEFNFSHTQTTHDKKLRDINCKNTAIIDTVDFVSNGIVNKDTSCKTNNLELIPKLIGIKKMKSKIQKNESKILKKKKYSHKEHMLNKIGIIKEIKQRQIQMQLDANVALRMDMDNKLERNVKTENSIKCIPSRNPEVEGLANIKETEKEGSIDTLSEFDLSRPVQTSNDGQIKNIQLIDINCTRKNAIDGAENISDNLQLKDQQSRIDCSETDNNCFNSVDIDQNSASISSIGEKLMYLMGWNGGGLGKCEQGRIMPVKAEESAKGRGLGVHHPKPSLLERKMRRQARRALKHAKNKGPDLLVFKKRGMRRYIHKALKQGVDKCSGADSNIRPVAAKSAVCGVLGLPGVNKVSNRKRRKCHNLGVPVSQSFTENVSELLNKYCESERLDDMIFSENLSNTQRAEIHELVQSKFESKLVSKSTWTGEGTRRIAVSKLFSYNSNLIHRLLAMGGKTKKYQVYRPGSLDIIRQCLNLNKKRKNSL